MTKNLEIIGINVLVDVADMKKIPAKVDTGADSSSIWASSITLNTKNQLEFCLFAPESEHFTGEKIIADDFKVKSVRSSNGQSAVRYQVALSVKIEKHKVRAWFTLADRKDNHFPILIGRKTLRNKFLVDVSKNAVPRPLGKKSRTLMKELTENPKKFHEKYMENR